MNEAPNETWVESSRGAPPPPSAPPVAAVTLGGGRVTVLPHLAVEGEQPRLVQEQRPRFEKLSSIGEGGLGVVVSARDLDIGRRVAIKRIRPDRQSQAAFLRFVQEVRTVGRLDHPNIVPIHDVGRDEDGGYYFVMKYVEGETLEAILDRLRAGDPETHAKWGFERRVELFQQILNAVSFAHERGVVHRDLKPANVMVGAHGEVQLLDWGVAKQLDQADIVGPGTSEDPDRSASVTHTRVGSLIGTPRYMSPEQARGEAVDVRCDTWALSLIFYEMLALTHPLDGIEALDEVLAAIQQAPALRPDQLPTRPLQGPVPAELGWYAVDGLKKNADDRYQTVDQMIDRLDRRNAGDFPIQCPITLQKRALSAGQRFVDRHPVWSMSLVVGSVVGAVVAVVGVVGAMGMVLLGAVGIAALG